MYEPQVSKQITSYSVEGEEVARPRGKRRICYLKGRDTTSAKRGSATLGARWHGRESRETTGPFLRVEVSIVPRSGLPNNDFPFPASRSDPLGEGETWKAFPGQCSRGGC